MQNAKTRDGGYVSKRKHNSDKNSKKTCNQACQNCSCAKEKHENLEQIFFQEKPRTLVYYQHLNRTNLIYGSPFESMLQYLLRPCLCYKH